MRINQAARADAARKFARNMALARAYPFPQFSAAAAKRMAALSEGDKAAVFEEELKAAQAELAQLREGQRRDVLRLE
jgi:hypothetical protein